MYEETPIQAKMEDRPRSLTINTTASTAHSDSFAATSLSYDKQFIRTVPGLLMVAEIIFGLLVWMLVAGTEYFRVPAFGWVMFIAVFYWILTVFFLILYLTMAYTKITQVPWTTVGLCFNCSAFVLYFTAAVVEATAIKHEFARRHDFNSWAASSFFAFVVTFCYAGNAFFSFRSWRARDQGP
ncbi:CKLF-like MARVEL transmembrane domain-containing protein 8b [Erpetoichthys calabaricus]|uniref:CKLF-like MARVEL transmembrane domain containing 8b n=1 Tax=Erpetoichthys calabaricus TaxID=27687 RepID=A0A8C4T1V0_ERPCA|nr:CKLF-like MARVEL transmembrane domain-containing protein 8b [Erpetoichthys calabaricus]